MSSPPEGEHVFIRPEWDCICGMPWPCKSARKRLTVEYAESPTVVRSRLTAYFLDAAADRGGGGAAAGRLYARIVGWLPT